MTFLVDTNVLSEIWKPNPDANVLGFLKRAEWYLPVPVIAEMQEGAEASPSEARKLEITARLEAFLRRHTGAVLDWDVETALIWARLKHSPAVKRQPQALWDSLIDALAVRHGFLVATRNTDDFRHAQTFNPWLEHPPGEPTA